MFSVNQNRQFYFVPDMDLSEVVTGADGRFYVKVTDGVTTDKDGNPVFERTDLVDPKKITFFKKTTAEPIYAKTTTISFEDGNNSLVEGKEYFVRIFVRDYLCLGDANVLHIWGSAVYKGDLQGFLNELVEDLDSQRTGVDKLFTYTVTQSDENRAKYKFTITPVEQPHVVGTMPFTTVQYKVEMPAVEVDGVEVSPVKKDDIYENEKGVPYPNGHKYADLEWFCKGEKGDQYRDLVGKKLEIPMNLNIKPTENYVSVNLEYYSGDVDSSTNSHKQIIFVAKDANYLDSLYTTIEGLM